MVIGLGVKENLVASDVTALCRTPTRSSTSWTARRSGSPGGADLRPTGERVERSEEIVSWSAEDAQKGGFEHFMLKEIFEEPQAIHNSMLARRRSSSGEILPNVNFNSIKIVACGTSFNAAMVGSTSWRSSPRSRSRWSWLRNIAIPPAPGIALVILIPERRDRRYLGSGPGGETPRLPHLGVTNVVGSLTREVDEVFYTHAGPEIGVAATKTYITQLIAMYIIGIRIGYAKRALSYDAMWSACPG